MTIRCPSCSRPIEIGQTVPKGHASATPVTCPHCGFLSGTVLEAAVPQAGDTTELAETNITPPENVPSVIQRGEPQQRSVIAHFELREILGRGSFGQVWLAEDTKLRREVALKLPRMQDQDPQLLHEAQTAAKLTHPGIVAVYEVGEQQGQIYIASEYIKGETLRDELVRGRPDPERAIRVLKDVATALHYAHEHGIVHRDIKPANIMIDEERHPHVTDFGIAKSVAADATISLDGQIVGTIAYMAPEQATGRNRQTDRRADIYALGVILFELLTEYRPFRGNAEGILVQKSQEDAPSPRALVPTLSRDLETICLKCLERDPERRYASAIDLADELDRCLNNVPILARPVSGWKRGGGGVGETHLSLVC